MNLCEATNRPLIDVKEMLSGSVLPGLSFMAGPVEKALSLSSLNHCYARFTSRIASESPAPEAIFDIALEVMDAAGEFSPYDLKRIPSTGPLVVVANHPFGGLEGVILAQMLLKVRKDVRVLGNYLLKRIEGIRDYIIAVDPFESRGRSAFQNRKGIMEALRWVKGGGALLTFPAGEVARFRLGSRRVTDPSWSPHIAGIIRRCRAATLPVYLPGRNSLLFHILGMFHPLLRTALLPRELVNKFGNRFEVVIGQPVSWPRLSRHSSDEDRIEYLRFAAYLLRNRGKKG